MRALLCLVALLHAGCRSLECGEGTFEDGDKCVGYDPDDKTPPVTAISPAGGRTREPIPKIVTLTTDEVARIYYTTDGTDPDPATQLGETSPAAVIDIEQGTTLKYFAIDRAGNREELVSTTFDSDTQAPAPVTAMAAALAGTTVTVTWTNPTDADYAGTVIARVADAIDVDPTPGMIYPGPATLSPSLQIVAVGKGAQFVDADRPAGPARYVAWTFDDVGNYSAPVTVRQEIPLGSLTAQLSVAANQTVTVTQSPANLDLTGTSATLAGTTLTLALSVKNNSARYFQNMKAEVTGVTGGAFSGSDGTADGFPFESLGPALVAPAATIERNLTFTGVAAGATVTINLTFAHHASMLATAGQSLQSMHVIDSGSGIITPLLATAARGPNDRANGRVRPSVLTGGRYLDIATTHGAIERWDLVTRMRTSTVKLAEDTERVNIQGLYASPNATYALIKYGGRRRVAVAELVRLDESLRVAQRLQLTNDDRGFTRATFDPTFTQLAIPLQGGVALIDLATFTQIDATPSTAFSTDLFEPGFTERIRGVQFFDNGNGMVVLGRTNGRAAIIRRTATDYTVTPYQDATNAKGFSIVTNTDGKIWMAFSSGLRVFDPATGNVSSITYGSIPNGLASLDGKLWVIRDDRVSLDQISNTGGVQRTVTLPANQGAFGHWIELAR